jgi:hypothetical protein
MAGEDDLDKPWWERSAKVTSLDVRNKENCANFDPKVVPAKKLSLATVKRLAASTPTKPRVAKDAATATPPPKTTAAKKPSKAEMYIPLSDNHFHSSIHERDH